MELQCSSAKNITKVDSGLKPLSPLVCKNIEETLTCQNTECGINFIVISVILIY